MKPLLVRLLALTSALLLSTVANAHNLIVVVENVASEKGMIVASLCDKHSFLKDCAMQASAKPTSSTKTELRFENVPDGTYALMVIHDENDNRKLDRDALGIPTEGYAFSRNARGRRGPPTFEDAAFEVKSGVNRLTVNLVY